MQAATLLMLVLTIALKAVHDIALTQVQGTAMYVSYKEKETVLGKQPFPENVCDFHHHIECIGSIIYMHTSHDYMVFICCKYMQHDDTDQWTASITIYCIL